MDLNKFIFPKPKCSYDKFLKNLIYIEKKNKEKIPCIYLKNKLKSNYLLLYFHGNSEDIGHCNKLVEILSKSLNIDALIVEYPKYGIYESKKITEKKIYIDSIIAYNYVINNLKYKKENILIAGLSLGSGPAIYLASKKLVYGVILIAPYLSIKKAAKDLVGSLLSLLVKDRFKNYKNITNIISPLLIIHGKNDKVINYKHSEELIELCRSRKKVLIQPLNMSHNKFDIYYDIINPIRIFFDKKYFF